MPPKKVILDCDPGHDDAIAQQLAYGSPEIELLAVTTVVGNQTLEKVTRNALAVARVAGISGVPFAAGCPRPLVRGIETAASVHGESGLDGPLLPEPTLALDPRHAVDLIIDTVLREEPGTVTLVPTAGLTNIALAVRKEPRLAELVREVVLMGGACAGGNWTPAAEFNMLIDPEAAHIVVNERWPLTMVGLDVTHQALATPDVLERIAAVGTRPATFVVELLTFLPGGLPPRPGLRASAGARPLRDGAGDRPVGADHSPRPAGRRADGAADPRHDRRRPARTGAGGLHHAGGGRDRPGPVLGPRRGRAGTDRGGAGVTSGGRRHP